MSKPPPGTDHARVGTHRPRAAQTANRPQQMSQTPRIRTRAYHQFGNS